jgi:hypothetical protein
VVACPVAATMAAFNALCVCLSPGVMQPGREPAQVCDPSPLPVQRHPLLAMRASIFTTSGWFVTAGGCFVSGVSMATGSDRCL